MEMDRRRRFISIPVSIPVPVPCSLFLGLGYAREAMSDLKSILSGRAAFYSKADATFDTSDMPLEDAFLGLRNQLQPEVRL